MSKKILIVDDDKILRETLIDQFSLYPDYEICEAGTGQAGLTLVRTTPIDVILLDINLPDMDGRDLCTMIKQEGYKGPVILLTAQSSEADTILGFNSGASDYVVKPFRFGVLLARIRAHLRQHDNSEDAVFRIGPYQFKPAAKLLIADDGRKTRLTEKETAIIKFLYRAEGKIVSREVLLHDVWGYATGITTHTLETHIYRLRQKIEQDPSQAEILITDSGGYKLIP